MRPFVEKVIPDFNKVYFINTYTLVHILDGRGSIEVDFKGYLDWEDKLIYLEPGQYIKFLSDDFLVRFIEFEDQDLFRHDQVRVLFKHLVSLGYINYQECSECQRFLNDVVTGHVKKDIIDVSSSQWFWQNPFGAEKDEYQIIFDVKELVDKHYIHHITVNDIIDLLQQNGYSAHHLFQHKVGISIKRLLINKLVLESKKDIAFTDKQIQEVAYDRGFKDPGYFNRFFLREMGQSPMDFRKSAGIEHKDNFEEDIIDLVKQHHKQQHELSFYADQMNMSVTTVSRKVRHALNHSLGVIIKNELLNSARELLQSDISIHQIARELHFEEPNHFTRFFKNMTGETPSQFRAGKSTR